MNGECPVTFIVPVFNVRDYIGELLESIKAQTFTSFRVLIGDDGSTDGTKTAVEPFLDDPRFTYLQFDSNRGLGAVMKDLMGRVNTRYWCNPGGDDRLHPEFLAQRLAAAAIVENPILVHGPPRQIDAEGRVIHHLPVFDMPQQMPSADFLEVLLYHNVVNNPGVMVSTAHTNLCINVMRTDLKYAPDWYWWFLHASLDGNVVFDPRPCIDYRIHAASLSGAPEKRWIRAEEIRRVPLVALQDASAVSPSAQRKLEQYGSILRAKWVLRTGKILIESRGAHALPDLSFLGPTRTERLSSVVMAIVKYLLTPSPPHGSSPHKWFIPSGIPFSDHQSLSVSRHEPTSGIR